ncbi:MAG: hypothetical protein CVU89_13620 [Firmicutes bacterium HGW-Firmicutes-14]|nr:MAG: hypothetical protein CVU89_13620 [Firmicutes bacterium HGW-Firmicutes-14]
MHNSGLLDIMKTGSIEKNRVADWSTLLAEANSHMVTELVAYYARSAPEGCIPPEIMESLNKAYKRNFLYTMLAADETEKALAALDAAGIRCMVLKGTRLAERLYGDQAARKSVDIDLLVEEHNLEKAASVLDSLGFIDMGNWGRIPTRLGLISNHLMYKKNTAMGCLYFELHFHLTDGRGKEINMHEIWDRAIKVQVGQTKAYDLSPRDFLLYLCIHSANHNYCVLRHVLDVAAALKLEGQQINWSDFIHTAKKYHASIRVYSSLFYAGLLLEAPVPAWVLEELQPASYLRNRLDLECLPDRPPTGLTEITRRLVRYEGIAGGLTEAWQAVFPPEAKMRLLYNIDSTACVCFYYPRRWLDLFRKMRRVTANNG